MYKSYQLRCSLQMYYLEWCVIADTALTYLYDILGHIVNDVTHEQRSPW